MKAIYTTIGGTVYKMNQYVNPPKSLALETPSRASVEYNTTTSTATLHVNINGMEGAEPKSNKEYVDEIVDNLKTNRVTEINSIENEYVMYVDYSVEDDGKVLEHQVAIRPVKIKDELLALGVNNENECCYRRVKTITTVIGIILKTQIPYGIMRGISISRHRTININDIVIFQKLEPVGDHPSIYEQPFQYGSNTIQSSLEHHIAIFSTRTEGISIQQVELTRGESRFDLTVNVLLPDFAVVYDESYINAILEENALPENPDDDTPVNPPTGDDGDNSGATQPPSGDGTPVDPPTGDDGDDSGATEPPSGEDTP